MNMDERAVVVVFFVIVVVVVDVFVVAFVTL